MKFISFKHNKQNKFGIINNNKITDLTGKVSNSNTLKDLIQNRIKRSKQNILQKTDKF